MAYRTTYKRSTSQTPFKMVYGQEAIVPLYFKKQTLQIPQVLQLNTTNAKQERLFHLQKLEEYRINSIHQKEVQKQQQKAWHDRNLRNKNISIVGLILLYDSKIKGKPRKLEITYLGPYSVEEINTNGSVTLKTLQGQVFKEVFNGACLMKCHP